MLVEYWWNVDRMLVEDINPKLMDTDTHLKDLLYIIYITCYIICNKPSYANLLMACQVWSPLDYPIDLCISDDDRCFANTCLTSKCLDSRFFSVNFFYWCFYFSTCDVLVNVMAALLISQWILNILAAHHSMSLS